MQNVRVLVTGGAGFIGRACVAALKARRVEVHAVSRRPQGAEGVTWHQADLNDGPIVHRLVDHVRPTHLLHLAWRSTSGRWATELDFESDIDAGLRVLGAFVEARGRRAVLVGTCAEYDWTRGRCHEDDAEHASPATAYGVAKQTLCRRSMALAAAAGLSMAWARVFFVYGPYEPATRLVPMVARAILDGKAARCTRGTQRRDFLYVDDVADALVAILGANVTGAVNVGSGRAVEVATLAQGVAQRLGRPDLLALGALAAPTDDTPLVEADTARLERAVGWRPTTSLDAGLDATVAWYRARSARAMSGGPSA